jgi:thiosulfate/3-mercaptopyruvate sulfurtransferase
MIMIFSLSIDSAQAISVEPQSNLLITPEQLNGLVADKTVIIDTRSKWRYLLSHISGAINLPDWKNFASKQNGVPGMLILDRKWIAEKLQSLGIDHEKTIVLYGNPKNPWRTDGRFFWMFQRYGFQSVKILQGGLEGWKRFGGKINVGPADRKKPSSLSAEDIQLDDSVTADKNWIRERLASGKIAIIDNRTQREYDGSTPYGSSRGGHIPQSVHIHWADFFTTAGDMKPSNVLLKMLSQFGITQDRDVVVYCTGGVRSAMGYFVLKYLGSSVRNYDGSWWEWSRDASLPVEIS